MANPPQTNTSPRSKISSEACAVSRLCSGKALSLIRTRFVSRLSPNHVPRSLTSLLKGIRFHGHTIPDCQKVLTPAKGGKEIIAESMLWLHLTGQVPTEEQTRQLSRELAENGQLPEYLEKLIDS